MSEKIYRVKLNSKGMPNFSTAVEIPQGEWIKTDKYYCGSRIYRCSLCCDEIDEMPTIMGVPMYNFCPNCGCRMRGDSNE